MLDETTLTERVTEIVKAHQRLEGSLLPILHAVQAEFGHVPQGAMATIAEGAGITRAELHGVISFYHDFREAPVGQRVVRLCRAEACQAMGSDAVAAEVQGRLGLDWHQTSGDGAVTLEPVFCLGLCACGPAAQVDGRLVGRATAAKVMAVLGEGRE